MHPCYLYTELKEANSMRKTKKKPISWAFGYKPVPCKGGKTNNSLVGETMIHRELKEASKD